MLKAIAAACAALALVAPAAYAQTTPEPIRVMIVGTWHMDNPGQDMNNVAADPVTTPVKQGELADVALALARFEPTVIAVERVADNSDLVDQGFARHTPGDYSASSSEVLQIGYRLADVSGVSRVYAIDEQADEGQSDYFPIGPVVGWAQANGAMPQLGALNEAPRAYVEDITARQRTQTIRAILADTNRADHPMNIGGHGAGYYQFLRFGRGEEQPGAELNGRWYTRNAYIFARLMQVARPGDRIVVVFGSGHNYWLRHFVETTPGFELVEATDYLAD